MGSRERRPWKTAATAAAAVAIPAAALLLLVPALQKSATSQPATAPARLPASHMVEPSDPPVSAAPVKPAVSLLPDAHSPQPGHPATPVVVQPGESVWEQRIAALLADQKRADSAKAQALLALLPQLPEELLQAAAQAAVDRLRDEDYAASALPLALDARTHGMIGSVLFADLMERPDEIALPALLAIARTLDHPFAPAAGENLELLLGRDSGGNWTAWSEAIQRRVAAPPK